MKRILSLILAVCLCLSVAVMITSCGDGEFDGVTAEKWKDFLSEQRFDNVTINFTLSSDVNGEYAESSDIVKIADAKVYRKAVWVMSDDSNELEAVFTGDEAVEQKKIFLGIFLSLLAERDNYVYDEDEGVYKAPNKITVVLDDIREGYHTEEAITNAKVKFDSKGNIEYFSGYFVETVKYGGEVVGVTQGDTVWTFSNFGTTVITEGAE